MIETDDIITLIVKNVKPQNSGNYYAQLVNEAGQLSTNKAQLIVNSKLNICISNCEVCNCFIK